MYLDQDENKKDQDPNKPSPVKTQIKDKLSTVVHFRRARNLAMFMSILSLAVFLYLTAIAVPLFFAHWYLIIPLFGLIMYTRSFGSWEAYLKVREQSDKFAEALDKADEKTAEVRKKFETNVKK